MGNKILVAGERLVTVRTGKLSLPVLHDNMLGQAALAARLVSTLATEALPCTAIENINSSPDSNSKKEKS